MLSILFIAIILVFCIDLSGAMDKANRWVWSKLYKGIKYTDWTIPLFGCSLCCTWWASLLYISVTGQLSFLMIAYIALIAFMTPIIKDIMILLKDTSTKLIDVIYKLIN